VAFDVGAICPHFRPRAIRRCTDRLSRINRSRDKMRGAASFAKIRASATGESDLPCIKVTCRAYMAPSGRLPVRVRTIAATPWNPVEGFKLTSRHLLPS
jgi:hypothetical protein